MAIGNVSLGPKRSNLILCPRQLFSHKTMYVARFTTIKGQHESLYI